jgi:Mycothiol maleylpyruvate isomerase N-terminal domain
VGTITDASAARRALAAAYDGVTRAVDGADDHTMWTATRCDAWVRQDLLFHLLCDAQRLLVAVATPSASAPTTDAIDYWRPYGGDASDPWRAAAHARFVRLSAAAYSSPAVLTRHWRDTSAAAVRAAKMAPSDGAYETQGYVLALPDLLVTFAVEAALHHLDLLLGTPEPEPLALVRLTLDGLLGGASRPDWDDATYALKATGRAALDSDESRVLADVRLPLLS